MDSAGCYLGLGLLLGTLIGAFFAEGNARRKSAVTKMQALETEKTRTGEMLQKARTRRRQGLDELPGAYLLMVLAIIMLILTVYILAASGGLF